ncbi:Major facilitator superfamily domain, general substrate transporter [Romboutsia lituseburensis]|nr:MFS transporter [Romboutsia lituseburensis]CEH33656.1 Major facilitator superfamily domain, general substrate transporter [Romboutsia lituseburensis]
MAIINGFGMSVKNTAEGMYITENTKEEERISIFSINFIVSNIGMMSASFIGGILSTYMSKYFTSQQSITYIFIISAILSILAFIPIYFMKEPKNLQSRNFKQCLQGYNHVISDRKVLYFMMYYLVIGIGAGMVVPFFSVYLKYSMNISDSIVGSILSISQFGCILGGSLIPFMSNKFGKSNSVIICQLISIPFLLSIAFPQGIILIAISFFMRNGLMNMATPLTQNLSMELVDKKDRTNLSSMISLCSNISRAIGISIGGVMMEKISYNSPYYLTVILYIIGVVIFANLYKKESKLVRQKKYKEEHAFRH